MNRDKLTNINKKPLNTKQHKNFRFCKENRLLKARMFSQVFEHAKFRLSNNYILLLAKPSDLSRARIGLVVAKKKIPLAVDRNHFKRLARESFRIHKDKLTSLDIILLAKKDISTLDTQDQHFLFEDLLVKLREKKSA